MASKPLQQLHDKYQLAVGDCSALSPPSDRVVATSMEETVTEQKLGFLTQFFTVSQMDGFTMLGSGRPCHVFCINEHGRLRMFDDGLWNSYNDTYASAEAIYISSR